jgi:hypothetical protein
MRMPGAWGIGLTVLLATGLTVTGVASTVRAEGDGGRRTGSGPLVVVDSTRREVGTVIGFRGGLASVAFELNDHFYPLQVGRDQILSASLPVLFLNTTCQSPAFVSLNLLSANSALTAGTAVNGDLTPAIFSAAGVGPGNILLGPSGAAITGTPLAQWSPAESPSCEPLNFGGDVELVPTVVLFDLSVFVPPFRAARP